MVEIRNGKKVLITPISREDLNDIRIGDVIWLDGKVTTCRDVAHRRLVEYGKELPLSIKDQAIFHAGPIVQEDPESPSGFEMVSVGPTTSMRMEKFEYEFIRQTGVRLVIGKGGMKEQTERACRDFGALHCPGRLCSGCSNKNAVYRRTLLGRTGNAGDVVGLQRKGVRSVNCFH